jgi:hypothetical protein
MFNLKTEPVGLASVIARETDFVERLLKRTRKMLLSKQRRITALITAPTTS